MAENITVLIISIALETGIPPYFALSIALTENETLNPLAVHWNDDGTFDGGVMQLNSWYFSHIDWRDSEMNIRAGCALIKELMGRPELNTYWAVACAYNCGYARFTAGGPPESTIMYAHRVIERWLTLQRHVPVLVGWGR